MGFKIGDKVKVFCNNRNSYLVEKAMGKIGVVRSVGDLSCGVHIEFDTEVIPNISLVFFYEDEIEKVSEKGKQLLFSFMNEAI